MKTKKRILSAILALAMIFTVVVPVLASAATTANGTETVTVHKLLMTKDQLTAWDENGPAGYDGTQNLTQLQTLVGTGQTLEEIAGVYFALKNSAGNWITAAGVEVTDPKDAEGDLTTANGISINVGQLPAGTYTIEEVRELSTYVGEGGATLTGSKAVPIEITLPLYQANGTLITDAHVYPKNSEEAPDTEKTFGDEAQDIEGTTGNTGTRTYNVGDPVPYRVTTTIPADTEYKTAVWSDSMDFGLTYNKDLVITVGGEELVAADYTIFETDAGFRVSLTEAGLEKINTTTGVEVVLTYSATLNEDAKISIPEENKVIFIYGNTPDNQIVPKPVTPENGQITVNKTWANADGTTAAPAGVTVTFMLFYADGTRVPGQEPITWTSGTPFPVWTGLDNTRQYIVVEQEVAGYTAEYLDSTAGTSNIKNTKSNNPYIEPDPVKVITGGKRFIKVDAQTKEALAGAEFVIYRTVGATKEYLQLKDAATQATELTAYNDAQTAYIAAVAAYNAELAKVTPENDNAAAIATAKTAMDNAKAARDTAYEAMNMQWTWGGTAADAFKFTSAQDGTFEVTGLAYTLNGVRYFLEETKPPAGYADMQSDVEFTVDDNSYWADPTAVEPVAADPLEVLNNKVTIPQTGGIGTVIFIVAGLLIMGTAVVVMKKRQELDV